MRPLPTSALRAGSLVLAATLLLPTAPANAGAPDSWRVPGQAWVTILGHGYGHGHGMSQYGAEGAARQGLTYREIADFYYPGTKWGTSRGRVTVLISADTSDDVEVLATRGLTLKDTAHTGVTELPDNGATRWRVSVGKSGENLVSFLTERWHRWATLDGEGQFFAAHKPITLVTPAGNRAYRGRLTAAAPAKGSRSRDTINELSLENYLRGVVPLEMPALWSPEAVRAQSVAARTYAAYERNHPHGPHYQLCDTSSCQVYGGYDAEHPASNAAIDATRREVLLSRGKPAFTQFGSSSGGWTSAGSVPYLTAREDPYDDWAGNPVHKWSLRLPDTKIEKAWPAIGNLRRLAVTSRDTHGEWGGRVRSITIAGDQRKVVVSGDTFRSVLGLRSTWLNFKVRNRG